MTAAAIIVAAGTGQRFGDTGKSFAIAGGKPMAWWSLAAAAESDSVDELVLVCGRHSVDAARELIEEFDSSKPVRLILGGQRRQDSALAGIQATSDRVQIVAIHDAARPLVSTALFDSAIAAASRTGAAIVAIPVSDTIKSVRDSRVLATIPREQLVSVQTPQAFHKQRLLDAFALAEQDGVDGTDEASFIEHAGGTVVVIPGSMTNIKVTWPEDLAIVETLMQRTQR